MKKPREVHDLDSVFWWLQKATDHAKALDCPGWETCGKQFRVSSRSGTLVGQATRGEPAEPNLRADAPRRLRRISRPSISSQCGLESFWTGTCFRNIVLMFFEKSSSNRNFVGNRRLFWGASEFPKAPAKGFSRRTAANFNLLLRVKVPLCKDFSA